MPGRIPDAVVAANDQMAIGVLRSLTAAWASGYRSRSLWSGSTTLIEASCASHR